ncbi:alpha/beta hydrolase [Weeksella virosa]|uniref:alpha/beta fold hydrolase n=1 Tax=Weeksella virosa TaxID=1014 RepID=UPI002552119F|nr:alpha/beta hydrolase [Weeksella virosa]MDK7674302.1 alpha/beta hydrolase [Weeksella virosa]
MLAYTKLGKGINTLIFLHGFLENRKIWFDLAEDLASDFSILLIDFPGHGLSKNIDGNPSVDQIAREVIRVADHENIESFTVWGHSMGGYVALAIADLFPQRLDALVLMNSTTFADNVEKKLQRIKAKKTVEKNLKTLINLSIPNLFYQQKNEEKQAAIEVLKEIAYETSVEGAQYALDAMRLRPDRHKTLLQFPKPSLVIVGKYDQTVNPRELLACLENHPTVTTKTLSTGHVSHYENYNEVLKIAWQFLRAVYY